MTMYRLVIYSLSGLYAIGILFAWLTWLPFSPITMLVVLAIIYGVCYLANAVFAGVFEAPSNSESVLITALILALIVSPVITTGVDLGFLIWVSILAMSAKYILAIRKKHLFNPAAVAVAITAFTIGQSASWWIGTAVMLPFTALVTLLITRKIRRFDLVLSFVLTASVAVVVYGLISHSDILLSLRRLWVDAPLVFFAGVMLTEPQTTPPTRPRRIVYGILTGLLVPPFVNFAGIYFTPELALIAGNVYSYLAGSKVKLVLKLKEKIKVATDTYDLLFEPDQRLAWQPGQYMEWTLAHDRADTRGIRRYFTIASSPTEAGLRLGVKFYPRSSTYKKSLGSLKEGDKIVASQLAGDFTLPKDQREKLVFIAGGIGVTPFRSIIKYLLDKNEKRDIVIFYTNNFSTDIAYRELFDEAGRKFSLPVHYVLTDKNRAPANWDGPVGFLTAELFARLVPDWQDRTFFLSGPQAMIESYREVLRRMGVPPSRIKTDYFPGFV